MISIKYKEMYDVFINHYKNKHVNPWHEISESELDKLYNNIVSNQDINDDYSFNYLMNVILKRLSGEVDAHSKYDDVKMIPMNFRIFGEDVIINYPDNLKGYELISINGYDIKDVLDQLDDVITYGTEGKRIYELEKALFNKKKMFGIPMFRGTDSLVMSFKKVDGSIITREFKKDEEYSEEEMFDWDIFAYGNVGTYGVKDKKLIINYSSVQNKFKSNIENMMVEISKLDLSEIDTIIVDIRGNTGGNSGLNKPLIDFIIKSKKGIICLTDYRVFSSGKSLLVDLIKLGAITIGTGISTPLNCYGNSDWIEYNGYRFSSSSCFFAPNYEWSASSKEEYKSEVRDEFITPVIFMPDVYIEQSKEDYLNGIDNVLEYALSMENEKSL